MDSVVYYIWRQGKKLSAIEVRKIWFHKGVDESEQEMALIMKRFKTAIHDEIIRKKDSNLIKRSERKNILATRNDWQNFDQNLMD